MNPFFHTANVIYIQLNYVFSPVKPHVDCVLILTCLFLSAFFFWCFAAATAFHMFVFLIHQVSYFMLLSLRSLFSSLCTNQELGDHEHREGTHTPHSTPYIKLFPLFFLIFSFLPLRLSLATQQFPPVFQVGVCFYYYGMFVLPAP